MEVRAMDIRILRNFLAVVREENITRAAESLHMAQSSLSKQLIELEKELGRQLLIRGKRRITLTEDGVLLRRRAEELVALFEKTERELGFDTAEIAGEISIGGAPLPKILQAASALRAEHPGVRFSFYTSDAIDVIERLDHGSLDFAILLEPVDEVKYEYCSLQDSARWGLLMPCDCALARKSAVQREDLSQVPLILPRREGLQRKIALWAQTEPQHMNIAATYNVVNSNPAGFVQSGLGCFLASEEYIAAGLEPGVCFRLLAPPLELHHALVWKRASVSGKVAAAFLEKLKAE